MKPQHPAGTAAMAVLAIALAALVSGGCSQRLSTTLVPNQPPEVRLTAAPAVRDSLHPDFYAYTLQWMGFDPDGRVDHYVYAVDPIRHKVDNAHPNGFDLADTCWHTTVRNEQTFFFSAGKPIEPINPQDPRAETPHEFAIFAVDDDHAVSKRPAERGFFSFTQAPVVNISDPVPNSSFGLNLTPSVTIRWTGRDDDGQFTSKPVRWVFRLFGRSNPDFSGIDDYISFALTHPDSMRKQYAPGSTSGFGDFKGWNSVGAETTSFQYTSLPQQQWLFVVSGFDEAGAYDPVFSPGKNMLLFSVTFASTAGPTIRMFNQFFDYTYPYGGFDESEARWFKLEVPAEQPVTFNWGAKAAFGADIKRYRWGLDLVDLSDETARTHEQDWRERHWSQWSLQITSTNVGPFLPAPVDPATPDGLGPHQFFIEAEDNNNLLSLGIISFIAVKATFEKDLLIVKDTRLAVDNKNLATGVYSPPVGSWPTTAELDTFLFARGNVPWKGRDPGVLTTPGIFIGYPYDTIGTRGVSLDGTVPLSLLGKYRHVVWFTDPGAATNTLPPNDPNRPISALRLISSPGHPTILSTYMTQAYKRPDAGFVWLCGGGAAFATLAPYNVLSNGSSFFSQSTGGFQEGRMMYDFAHWQVGIGVLPSVQAKRFGTTTFQDVDPPFSAGRGWPDNPPLPTPPTAPDYDLLPITLHFKNPATDPFPPGRSTNNTADFYQGDYQAEYIYQPTFIREGYGPDADHLTDFSTLDTLYITSGASTTNGPVMTYYHGHDCQPFIFSGFNLWYWRRSDCIDLVDWVLHEVWGLQRDQTVTRTPNFARASVRRAAP